MKLKRLPSDFRVDEQISLQPEGGEFALYRLIKESLSTLEAVRAIVRHWKLPRQSVAFAGLKDKHALTVQYLTIERGPRRGFRQTNLTLEYIGQVPRPIHASDIQENRFQIVVRDLSVADANQARELAGQLTSTGVPNYFDDQRFGSVGQSGEHIARPWCLGDYERTLWLALADPSPRDRREQRDEKHFLRDHWGDWPSLAERYPRSDWASVYRFLEHHPANYRRAIAQVPHELRSLWLAAYQSHLWNKVLAHMIEQASPAENLIWHTIGRLRVPFVKLGLPVSQLPILLPLPSARLHLADSSLAELYAKALVPEGLEMRQLRVKYPRDTFFSKGERPTFVLPHQMQAAAEADELHAGRSRLALEFNLPRGSYATIVVKQVLTAARPSEFEGTAS